MKRLIDDMTAEEIERYYMISIMGLSDCLKELCKPINDWYENLDSEDNQTWVLCYVSYDNPYECDDAVWIGKYKKDDVYPFGLAGSWKKQFFRYATPVDLNIRYKENQK